MSTTADRDVTAIGIPHETRRRVRNVGVVLAAVGVIAIATRAYLDRADYVGPRLCRKLIEDAVLTVLPEARIADAMPVSELDDGSYKVSATVVQDISYTNVPCQLVRVGGDWTVRFDDAAE